MRRYEAYKDTGLFWLPQIPQKWEWKFLSQVAKEQKDRKPENIDFAVMSLSYGNIIRKKNLSAGLVPGNYNNYQVIRKGNIILRLTDLQNDHTSLRTGLAKETGIITSAYTCLCPLSNSAYLHYLLHAYDIRKVFYGMGGGVRQSIGYKDIRNMYVPCPSHKEQDQIVRYLEWQTSKINRLIAAKKQQIQVLREQQQKLICEVITKGVHSDVGYKDSHIAWIGDIPSHWSAIRCKYLFRERDERSKEGMETHLSMSQKYGLVPDSQLDERRMLSESYAGGKLCYQDDLVLNRLKAHLGVFALAPQFGVISPDYTVLIPNTERIIPSFGEMVLKSALCRRELRVRVRGIIEGFWRLYTDDFYTIYLPVPPIEEQKEIMQYVDAQAKMTAALENALNREIELLHELRTRLISDVVTGQIDVRSIEVPDFELVEELADEAEEPEDEMEVE